MRTPKLKEAYTPERCECCGQTTTYILPVTLGVVQIIRAIATAIHKKGTNYIHPRKEMEVNAEWPGDQRIAEGKLTSNEVGNLSKARFHGLIAREKDNPGNYCLTDKGIDFLNGEDVPKFAIISKEYRRQIGYYKEEEFTCNIKELIGTDYWVGIGFEIREGKVVEVEDKQGALI